METQLDSLSPLQFPRPYSALGPTEHSWASWFYSAGWTVLHHHSCPESAPPQPPCSSLWWGHSIQEDPCPSQVGPPKGMLTSTILTYTSNPRGAYLSPGILDPDENHRYKLVSALVITPCEDSEVMRHPVQNKHMPRRRTDHCGSLVP